MDTSSNAKQDPSSISDLITAAAAFRRRNPEHVRLRKLILSQGDAALSELDRLRGKVTDPFERLLCESLALQLRRPDLVKLLEPPPVNRSMLVSHVQHIPTVQMVESRGRKLAAMTGRDAIPLYEEALVFGGPVRVDGALFALAEFKEDRSIPMIIEASKSFGFFGDDLIAAALICFGEKGIAAARDVPAPDLACEDVDGRASQFVHVTAALVSVNDSKAVENILAGLRQQAQAREATEYRAWRKVSRAWHQHMQRILSLASKVTDPRILDLLLAILPKNEDLATSIIPIISNYDDPRVVPACAHFLSADTRGFHPKATIQALLKRLGGELGPFLSKKLSLDNNDIENCAIMGAFRELGSPSSPYFQNKEVAIKQSIRECAVAPLIQLLKRGTATEKKCAAEALAVLAKGSDQQFDVRATKALEKWMRSGGQAALSSGRSKTISSNPETDAIAGESALPSSPDKADLIAQFDPRHPAAFRSALWASPKDYRLQRRLYEVLRQGVDDRELEDTIKFFLWKNLFRFEPPETGLIKVLSFAASVLRIRAYLRRQFIADLQSPDENIFNTAVSCLCRERRTVDHTAPRVKPLLKVLKGRDTRRRITVLKSLGGCFGNEAVQLAANAVAPFLLSEIDEERATAESALSSMVHQGWLNPIEMLAQTHPNEKIREATRRMQDAK